MIDAADLALLPALEALLSESNVTRAARRLGISQPAMSARLARLRDITGDALLVPTGRGRGMTPTPYALALRGRLQLALASAEAALRPAGAFDPAAMRSTVRIVTSDNAAALVAAGVISRLQASAAPGLRLALLRPDGRAVRDWLESGQADFAIAADDLQPGDAPLRRRLLLRDHFATALRKNHPRARAALDLDLFCDLDHLIVSGSGDFEGVVDRALRALGRTRRVALSTFSYTQAPLIAAQGDLLVTAPSRLLRPLDAALVILEPPLELEPVAWQLLWHDRLQGDAAHAWVRDALLDSASRALA